MNSDNPPRAMYAQKRYDSTVHYTAFPQRVLGYGNFTLMCGTRISGLTSIRYVPHGAKVCKRCVNASMKRRARVTVTR